jgi:hypothetical protein
MRPVRTAHSNLIFTGSEGSDIGDLPATLEDGIATSVWEPDANERRQLANEGRVALQIDGAQPPVALIVVGPDCENCGKPMRWDDQMAMYLCSEDDEIDAEDHPLL